MSHPRIEKKSADGREEKGGNEEFLQQIYGVQPLYYSEEKLNEEIDEKSRQEYESLITHQVSILIAKLKLEFNKNDIYARAEKELGKPLEPDQKKLLFLKTLNPENPLEKLFIEEQAKLAEYDDWDDVLYLYFNSYNPKSHIPYAEKPDEKIHDNERIKKLNEIQAEHKKDRILAFTSGKKILEEILFEAQKPNATDAIVNNALKNLHRKIKDKVCVQGFVNELTGTIAELNLDPISQAVRVLTNLATEHINEIKAKSTQRHIDLLPGMETHGGAELVNYYIEHNKECGIPLIKERYVNIVTEDEKKAFAEKCMQPALIANLIIDDWVTKYLSYLQDAQVPEKKSPEEITDKEKKLLQKSVIIL